MLRRWWLHLFLVFVLSVTVLALLESYFENSEQSIKRRSQDLATEIAENVRDKVIVRTQAMQMLADSKLIDVDGGGRTYEQVAEALAKNYGGFYSIAYINPSGVIQRVYPYEKNKIAIGINVNDLPNRGDILELAKKSHQPAMTHIIRMLQGMKSFLLYVPIYRNNELRGFLAGLVDVEGWFHDEILKNESDIFVDLSFDSDPKESLKIGGNMKGGITSKLPFHIWNQDLTLEVTIPPSRISPSILVHEILYGLALALTALAGFFVLNSRHAYLRTDELNKQLRLKNSLISSLAHDMSTPLTVLTMTLEKVRAGAASGPWDRIDRSMSILRRMLETVRVLHAVEMRRLEFFKEKVDLSQTAATAIELIDELAESRKIEIVNAIPPRLYVQAHKATLEQNVLPNVLTNAIKYSRVGSRITMSAVKRGDQVEMSVHDSGTGDPASGTGLGVIQVHTFMELYGGSFSLSESAQDGTTALLVFKAVEA